MVALGVRGTEVRASCPCRNASEVTPALSPALGSLPSLAAWGGPPHRRRRCCRRRRAAGWVRRARPARRAAVAADGRGPLAGAGVLWVLVAMLAALAVLWASTRRRWAATLTVAVDVRLACSPPMSRPACRWTCSSRAGGTSSAPGCRAAPRRSPPCRCPTRAPTRGRRHAPAARRAARALGGAAGVLAARARAAGTCSSRSPCCSSWSPRRSCRSAGPTGRARRVLTALTVCFLWLERLPLRRDGDRGDARARRGRRAPARLRGRRRAALVRLQVVRGGVRARRAARVRLGSQLRAADWPREGAEVLRVDARPGLLEGREPRRLRRRASGRQRSRAAASDDRGRPGRRLRQRPAGARRCASRCGGSRAREVLGAGTTLRVEDSTRAVHGARRRALLAIRRLPRRRLLHRRARTSRSSRRVSSRTPTPGATAAPQTCRSPCRCEGDAAIRRVPRTRGRGRRSRIRFPPFHPGRAGQTPFARLHPTSRRSARRAGAAPLAVRARRWRLAKRLRRDATRRTTTSSPSTATSRTASPTRRTRPRSPPGRATLDGFLFETKQRLLPALLGRDGAAAADGRVPARVVTGFSPGWLLREQARVDRARHRRAFMGRGVVRRLGLGHVRPDARRHPGALADRGARARRPRPAPIAATPHGRRRPSARAPAGSAPTCSARSPGPGGAGAAAGSARAGRRGGGSRRRRRWCSRSSAWCVLRWRRRSLGPAAALDRAVAELEAALRRAGPPGDGGHDAAAARAAAGPHAAGGGVPARAPRRPLRAGRAAADAGEPPALRRELASGRGPVGRLRALWALPPWRV